jgi:CDP-glycerol glycerophosphotransferase (TagB/SpsB family)
VKSPTPKAQKRGGIMNSLLYIGLLPVYVLVRLVPRNQKLVAFGSGHGQQFIDNAKYFFLYCAKNLPDSRCVFFSKNHDVVKRLRRCGYETLYVYSLKGLLTAIRAGKWCISHSTHDIHALLSGGAEIVQLWHGTPLKLICYDVLSLARGFRQKMKNFLRGLLFSAFPYLNTSLKYNKLIVSSEHVRNIFKTAFRATDDQVLVTGQPRNDALASDFTFDPELFPEIAELDTLRNRYRYVITWLPTHRLRSGRGTLGLLENYSFDPQSLEQLLTRYDSLLLAKVHFLDSPTLVTKLGGFSHVEAYRSPDPYPLLRFTDLLITDYSSVSFDFLLLNRPIIFTPFDLDDYIDSDAPFYYDYNQVTPGRKCFNWTDLLDALDYHLSCLSKNQPDTYHRDRLKVCQMFNEFYGGFSSRVAENTLHHSKHTYKPPDIP